MVGVAKTGPEMAPEDRASMAILIEERHT